MKRVLFILKRREDYNDNPIEYSAKGLSTGLLNSAGFVNDMLVQEGIESKLVVVIDNNDIDREVTKYRPTHVIIEALWVVHPKFEVLTKLHPSVNWIIRLHSELPFIAGEGIAMEWILNYLNYKNMFISCNAPRMLREVRNLIKYKYGYTDKQVKEKVWYQPNYYPKVSTKSKVLLDKPYINIACFGSIRPLKNQLLQAYAAIEFAHKIGKKLYFHVNCGRYEMKGEPIWKNLVELFKQTPNTELVIHKWLDHDNFLKVLSTMDISMQVSNTETFNIVSCDALSQGIPVVLSDEIPWSSWLFTADPMNSISMVHKLYLAYYLPKLNVFFNAWNLNRYCDKSKKIWLDQFGPATYSEYKQIQTLRK